MRNRLGHIGFMGNRRKARECALQVLYQVDFLKQEPHAILPLFWESHPASSEVREFAEHLVEGVWRNRAELDSLIESHSTNWRLDRMPAVDRNILRLATYELVFERDIAASVTLNEAIEIAKRFGTEDSSSFVNGVLDPISKDLKQS